MRVKASPSLYIPAPRLNQLHILREIAADWDITQAELARRCALSVAMVNNYMKELCDRGFLEYRRKNSKTISYYVTAAGNEVIEATQTELLQELSKLFAAAKEQVREIIMSRAHRALRRVVLYGNGLFAEIASHALADAHVEVIGVCSDDSAGVNGGCCGRERFDISQIRYLAPDAVVIALMERCDDAYLSLTHLSQYGIDLIRLDCRITETAQMGDPIAFTAAALG